MAGFFMLILNLFLNWIPLALLLTIFFDYPKGMIIAGVIVVVAGLFAISPINESIGRTALGCRPATTEERQKILGAWKAVVGAIGKGIDDKTRERFEEVELFVSDEKIPNAFALGRKTVCVTKGLLNLSSPADIIGVLAHEAGHLHFGDSQRLAMALTANRLGVVSYSLLNVANRIFEGFSKGVTSSGSAFGREGGLFVSFIGLILWGGAMFFSIVLKLASFVFKVGMDVGLHAVGRNEEFRADMFAKI